MQQHNAKQNPLPSGMGSIKIKLRKRYYKRSQKGRSPASFNVRQSEGVGSTIHATIKLDPVLKKHKDLRESIVKHEVNEIKAWGEGHHAPHAHARHKEPKLTKHIGGVSGFWKEIEKRGR